MGSNQQDITGSPPSTTLSSHTPESFFISNEFARPVGGRFGKIRLQLGQTLRLASRLNAKLPLSPVQDHGTPPWSPPSPMSTVSPRESEPSASLWTDATDDEGGRTTPDTAEEIISEAALVPFTPHRYALKLMADDENGPTTHDTAEEFASEAAFSTFAPRRYTVRSTADTVITYATSLAPSDMPLYTRMETRSIAASLSGEISWRRSTMVSHPCL
jgi:hypothetical protein